MVEAPGYCPPGPKCLFHLTFYRHSRRTGSTYLGILQMNLKVAAVMATVPTGMMGNEKVMRRLAFVTIGTAALALAACNKNNPDTVENAEINQPQAEQLNDLANQAAEDAANAQAAANSAKEAANEANAVAENTVNPQEADEQNVSGM